MRILLVSFLLSFTQSVLAINPLLSLKLSTANDSLSKIEHILQNKSEKNVDHLKNFHTKNLDVQLLANECIDENEFSINKSADDLDLLGAQTVPEEKEITAKRVSLNQNMLSSAQQLATCRLMLLRATESLNKIELQRQALIKNRLFTQRSTLLDHIEFNVRNPLSLLVEAKNFVVLEFSPEALSTKSINVLSILALVLISTFFIKKGLKSVLNKKSYDTQLSLGGQIQFSIMSCTNHYLPMLLSSVLISVYLISTSDALTHSFLTIIMIGVSMLTFLVWLIRIFLNPCSPAKSFINVDTIMGQQLSRRLRILAWMLFIGFLLYFAFDLYAFNRMSEGIVRNVFIAIVALNLIWITFILGEFNALANTLIIRLLLILALIGSLICDWLGYTNLSIFILIGLSGSVFLLLAALFFSRLFSDFVDGFDEGRYLWQKQVRKYIGVKTDEYIPGAIWIRLSISILIWSLAILLALKIWGLSDSRFIELKGLVLNGFSLGSINIIPTRILISLLSFSVMISFVGWIKRRLDKSWLNRSRMDRGTKEAMISLTGYFGMAMSFLITLSIAGVQLANLAIVAGALSVGIGFGLQNIVNNFVSGVILLFERPIKTGDWVSVGSTEGYVRKISIRSTQIQTFDRSDVLVPNSELISGQVTNWMLKDSRGRLIVPVGVAYGTDAEKVKNILLGIAYNHEQVIKNSPILSDPYVLFRQFADSSLNFELRCFLINVDTRLRVLSDINFEINRLFNEHNIDIPFPQRDLNIKQSAFLTKDQDTK